MGPPRGDRQSPPSVGNGVDARLGFAGDVMLARRVERQWEDRDPSGVWGPLADRLRGLDGLFLNLECCLSTRGEPWPDKTYHFRADPEWAVPALEAVDTTWASLANNHSFDFGPAGLRDTRQSLASADIAHAGAGPDRVAALTPSVVSAGPLDVGVVALTDRFPDHRAGEDDPGTAYLPLDLDRPETRGTVRRLVRRARTRDPDLVVASLHWGPNWETRPDTDQRRFARWLVEQGVDLVHGHSAHVVQGIERHRGRPILYDTGDLVDDFSVKPALRNDLSFLFVLDIADGAFRAIRLVPVELADERVRPADDAAAASLSGRMAERCEPFGTELVRDGAELVVSLG
jgi:poly-gamma-glutamate capsule biosynthesis protein CapA/YwtB (metallophosphatase superfamily)